MQAPTESEQAHLRVAVLEDQQVLRESLVAMMERAGMQVVISQGESESFILKLSGAPPDVAVVDLMLDHADKTDPDAGFRVLQVLHDFHPRVRTLVLTGRRDPEALERAFALGAAGYLTKLNVGVDEVVGAVKAVARGERLAPAGSFDELPRPPPPAQSHSILDRLTAREREVLGYVASGADNLKIAACLGITERTVKAHVTSLYRKLGIENRIQMAMVGAQLGLARSLSSMNPPAVS